MDKDERWFVEKLFDRDASDGDVESSIGVLEVLLSVEALPSLIMFMVDASRPLKLREQAAVAIRTIDSETVQEQLRTLKNSREADIRRLAEIALNEPPNEE